VALVLNELDARPSPLVMIASPSIRNERPASAVVAAIADALDPHQRPFLAA
jgi:hypothetical protein